ncbi:von Willebrand factor type A domain protein [Stieleria maiorica]|uniref:von Willebrand factor type A domain protein n=1 Tax=Stieleria maiorica TaxID=2795974 RepID=A0A5B9MT61_9BACT|nr:vWA domain-containing protein [Stieleria maiorica]QEG02238.1 von Willebrand factor type A domain protein [Stieleria maiorica]
MSDLVTVSNGKQFFRIPSGQLPRAQRGGYYRPGVLGRTIVSDGTQIFEIPLADLPAAMAEGYRDVLAIERPSIVCDAVDSRGESSEDASARQAPSQAVSAYRRAELEQEALHEQLREAVDDASILGKPLAWIRLWWFEQREALLGQLRTNGLSIALHVALLLLLSTIFLAEERISNPDIITVSTAVEEAIQEVVIEQVEVEVTEPVEEVVEEVTESIDVTSEVTEQFVSVDLSDSFDGSLLAPPAGDGDGDAMETPAKAKLQFFGSKTEAVDFVFVIDNSNSMTQGRFETALNELVKAVGKLNKRQKFYVIFYSDTAYPLFHPYSPKTLVPATTKNKQMLVQWLQTVPLCLRTDGKEALQLGFNLEPDVMFVLGDGAFTDGASRYFSQRPNEDVVVHTLGMEVNAKNAATFKQLADKHRGTYQDVGVHPQAAVIAKQFPRPKNRTRNGYWGLKLPANDNKMN